MMRVFNEIDVVDLLPRQFEGALDYAMDEHNARLGSADTKSRVEAAHADIIAGRLRVADYTVSSACR